MYQLPLGGGLGERCYLQPLLAVGGPFLGEKIANQND